MGSFTDVELTDAVLSRMAGASDPRFRQVMTSLINHLHAFVREVELTEDEWLEGIRFLTATGQKCDDKRQEFILLSDVLGVSMLVDAINHRHPEGATESTVLGPFFVHGAPEIKNGDNLAAGWEGEPAYVSGRVLSANGDPVGGALLDIWQSDEAGHYDIQLPDTGGKRLRARLHTGEDGSYYFRTIKPASYPVPTDGPVGLILDRMGRHPMRPAHIHFIVAASGFETLVTHLFVEGDPYLESDVVFAVKDSLVVPFERVDSEVEARTVGLKAPFYRVSYDFVLRPSNDTKRHRVVSAADGVRG